MPTAVARRSGPEKSGQNKRQAKGARSTRALTGQKALGNQKARGEKTPAQKADAPRRTQEQRRKEAERKILKAAFQIIVERGLDDLTLQEAGERAGYSRALPAHYFASRNDLIGKLADFVVEGYIRRLYRAGPPKPGLEGFLARIAFNLENNTHDRNALRAFHVILGAGLARPEMAPRAARFDRQSVERIASMLRVCQENGEIPPHIDVQSQSIIILSALRGIMGQYVVSPKNVPIQQVTKVFIDNLRRDLTAPATPG